MSAHERYVRRMERSRRPVENYNLTVTFGVVVISIAIVLMAALIGGLVVAIIK